MATKLLNETTYAQERLQNSPDNVAEFVEYSEFLYKTNDSQKEYSERGVGIHAMYKLMSEYNVTVPDAGSISSTAVANWGMP